VDAQVDAYRRESFHRSRLGLEKWLLAIQGAFRQVSKARL
jgi:hypothetical protein